MSDPYKILGISRDATDDEVKKAYNELDSKDLKEDIKDCFCGSIA